MIDLDLREQSAWRKSENILSFLCETLVFTEAVLGPWSARLVALTEETSVGGANSLAQTISILHSLTSGSLLLNEGSSKTFV